MTRDIKRYIAAQSDRTVPVGYSAADVSENVYPSAVYFACGDDETARSDFFAFNDYSWCDPSSFTQSGWDAKVDLYSNYSLPIFLSEFGCIKGERQWEEIASLYSSDMTGVYSGGLVYEYTEEGSGYGLVTVSSSGDVETNPDFDALVSAYEQTPVPSGDGGARETANQVPECPAETENWEVSPDNMLPEIPQPAVRYINNGAGDGPGLGVNTQNTGTPSDTDADLSNGSTSTDTSDDPDSASSGSSSSSSSDSSSSPSSSSNSDSSDSEEGAASSLNIGMGGLVASLVAVGALLL